MQELIFLGRLVLHSVLKIKRAKCPTHSFHLLSSVLMLCLVKPCCNEVLDLPPGVSREW